MDTRNGHLINATERFLLHSCNAQGRMSKGISNSIKINFGNAYTKYCNICSEYDKNELVGRVIPAECQKTKNSSKKIVLTAIIKKNYMYRKVRSNKLPENLWDCMHNLNEFLGKIDKRHTKIAAPKVHCRSRNGQWDEIKEVLERAEDRLSNISKFIVYSYKHS